jgi:hypothetical protein
MRPFFALLFLPLMACGQTCDLVGTFVGTFAGDLSGDVHIEVLEDKETGMADLALTLTTADTELYGAALITCTDGQFALQLVDADGNPIGDFGGLLGSGGGDGDWTFDSGESGTWEATEEE